MDSLRIEGGCRLEGEVKVPGSKNAALPLLCLSLLSSRPLRLTSVPQVEDMKSLKDLLSRLGVQEVEPNLFHCQELKSTRADYELVRKMRASILVLGPLLARAGQAEVSLPGGCAIGERPVDIHLEGLKRLGADCSIEQGYIKAAANELIGAEVELRFPSVTGTINLMTAATAARGESLLKNVAREPEVRAVARALRMMGVEIEGEGTSEIRVKAQSSFKEIDFEVPSDRIQLITYLAAAAITGGSICCEGYEEDSIDQALSKFQEMGCKIRTEGSSVSIEAPDTLMPVNIKTAPFPGFPTDAQAQFMACASLSEGTSHIEETIFENRFQHASELRRMGAQIKIQGNLASISGVKELSGAEVMASDLRASASLVLAGLAAKGETQVRRVYHLDRGYENLENNLNRLGAKIRREPQ